MRSCGPTGFSRPATNSGAPSGPYGCFGTAQVGEILLCVLLQQCFEMRNSIQDWLHRDERIVYPGEMGSNAGPLPIFGPGDQAGAHRVQADIANGADEMEIVEHDEAKRLWNKWPVQRPRALMKLV